MAYYQQQQINSIVNDLQEMFPNHSRRTIENIVISNRGNAERAASALLSIPEDKYQQQQPQQNNFQNHEPPRINNSINEKPKHIFPTDFLRWPITARVIREVINQNPKVQQSNNQLQTGNQNYGIPSIQPMPPVMQLPMQPAMQPLGMPPMQPIQPFVIQPNSFVFQTPVCNMDDDAPLLGSQNDNAAQLSKWEKFKMKFSSKNHAGASYNPL